MSCIHLQQLYKLCQQYDLKLSGSDLIQIVCNQCGQKEVCPSALIDEFVNAEVHIPEYEGTQDG